MSFPRMVSMRPTVRHSRSREGQRARCLTRHPLAEPRRRRCHDQTSCVQSVAVALPSRSVQSVSLRLGYWSYDTIPRQILLHHLFDFVGEIDLADHLLEPSRARPRAGVERPNEALASHPILPLAEVESAIHHLHHAGAVRPGALDEVERERRHLLAAADDAPALAT